MPDHTIHVFRNKGWRPDTHLEVSVVFKSANGRLCWVDGSHEFEIFEDAEAQLTAALRFAKPFVRDRWVRVEVCVPNRDAYGNLRSGDIGKDCGVLLATRTVP